MNDPRLDPKHLLGIIGQQNKAIEKLLAERDEARALLEANGEKLSALTCLQRTYNNPQASEANRIKAAAAAISFELPKVGTTNSLLVVDFRERVRQARLKAPYAQPQRGFVALFVQSRRLLEQANSPGHHCPMGHA